MLKLQQELCFMTGMKVCLIIFVMNFVNSCDQWPNPLFLGKIPYFTLPPKRDAGEGSDAVIIWEDGKEFNIDEIYKAESSYIGGLKSIEEFHHIEIPPNAPPGIDEEMLEVIILKLVGFPWIKWT